MTDNLSERVEPSSHDETGFWSLESFKKSTPNQLRVLYVENDDADYALVSTLLGQAVVDPTPILERATSLSEAIERIRSSDNGSCPVDIILLNLSLSDSSGIESFRRLSEKAPGIPITILNDNDDPTLALSLVQEGAQDCLHRGEINSDILTRSILYSVERARAYRELERVNGELLSKSRALKEAQLQLIQTEKLDSIGRLAAGVAHEVKNPLATIQMGVDFFRRRQDDDSDPGFQMVNLMAEAIDRAESIIGGMLDFSRTQTLDLEMHNANDLLRELLRLVEHETVKHKVSLALDLDEKCPAIRCDRVMIEQVLINICNNAIHSMANSDQPNSRRLHLRTFWDRIQEIERDAGLRHFERLRPEDYVVVIEIRDEGKGIPEEKLSRIYEPFYTTKQTGEGTGLGLAITKNIIELHGGHIAIKNVENPRGLRVRLFFKAHQVPKNIPPP